MKYFFSLSLLYLLSLSSFSQTTKPSVLYKLIGQELKQGAIFTGVSLFSKNGKDNPYGGEIVSSYAALNPDKAAITKLFNEKYHCIKLLLPGKGNQTFTLLLKEEKINSTDDFFVSSIDKNGSRKSAEGPGLHYRGYLEGDSTSLAAVSIFRTGEVMALFAGREGDFVVGRMKGKTDEYVLYKSDNMIVPPGYNCSADEPEYNYTTEATDILVPSTLPVTTEVPTTLCRKMRVYWEGDYNLYSYNFSSNLTNTQNYLNGLFNIFATLYQNEGIIVELAKTLIWTTADTYANTGSSAALSSFKTKWNGLGDTFNGDLAHLIAGGTTNYGGVAYVLSNECSRSFAYAYSNVRGSYQAFPNYSWDAEVVTHETGHNFGSKHTHWCGWKTGPSASCGAIDNCATVEAFDTCSTCTSTTNIGAPPAGFKGTIMSYCHLRSGIGISLANGFGPLPQAKIRSNVSAGTCLTTSSNWTGTISTAWENAGNWSCGAIPNSTTDVIISSGLTNYPIINSAATCRSIRQASGTTLKVNPAFSLKVTATPN